MVLWRTQTGVDIKKKKRGGGEEKLDESLQSENE